jgi:hypothetical protein
MEKAVAKFGHGICSYCKKEFVKRRTAQNACSTRCRNRQYWVLHPKPSKALDSTIELNGVKT